jgi:signal transduction histidine kinase
VIDVSDDGRGPMPHNGDAGGHGIAGIRERVGAAGGGMEVGQRDGGGFRLRAWLPTNGMNP